MLGICDPSGPRTWNPRNRPESRLLEMGAGREGEERRGPIHHVLIPGDIKTKVVTKVGG